MAATTSPALPAFSYAQAAKGLAPAISATNSQPESSVNVSDMSSTEKKAFNVQPEKLEPLHTTPSAGKNDETPNDIVPKMVGDDGDIASNGQPNPDKKSSSITKLTSSSHSDSKQVSESTSPSLVASVATLPREDENSSTQNGSSESWDKQSETSAPAEKAVPSTAGEKDKNRDDDWVNLPASKVEKALKAAPIPAVNIWQQRKEAQEARVRANAGSHSSIAVAAPIKTKPPTQPGRHMEVQAQDDETKRRPSGKIADRSDGNSKKKQAGDIKVPDDGKCSFFLLQLLPAKLMCRQETSSSGPIK